MPCNHTNRLVSRNPPKTWLPHAVSLSPHPQASNPYHTPLHVPTPIFLAPIQSLHWLSTIFLCFWVSALFVSLAYKM
ncbi:hypothetical protein K1719_036092 [Acacia pycnantha]|nr:hypothetical protein K1719_036092 [Acacia pycnantha]